MLYFTFYYRAILVLGKLLAYCFSSTKHLKTLQQINCYAIKYRNIKFQLMYVKGTKLQKTINMVQIMEKGPSLF